MTKANYIQWLETQIVRAQELGGMDLEIWAFRQCLEKARDLGQELPIPDSVGQSEQLPCDECVDGQKWSPYYAKYVKCDCRK